MTTLQESGGGVRGIVVQDNCPPIGQSRGRRATVLPVPIRIVNKAGCVAHALLH